MMQQQPIQQQQKRRHRRTRLAAAFALASRGQSLEDQSAFQPEEVSSTTNTNTKQACPLPVPVTDYESQQQDQQQVQQVQDTTSTTEPKHEAISFLEEHGVPTFVPVFESVDPIRPKCNESLRGQVPWKCAFCHTHSFGHHCQGCVRHRDAAALRIFVGQLCKEGTQDVVQKMVEVLCPNLTAPTIFVEPHTDATSGRGKGCAWIYVHAIEDIPYVVKCLNKRTFVTVDENSGNVGFVAFPTSFSNQEIEECFQIDHDAQSADLQALFLFTCIAAQVPKAFNSWGLVGGANKNNNNINGKRNFVQGGVNAHFNKNNNNQQHYNNNQHQQRFVNHHQQQQQQQLPPPPPPSYGGSLPPPPAFTPVVKPQTQQQQQQQQPFLDNRQYEEAEQQYQMMEVLKKQRNAMVSVENQNNNNVSQVPKVFLGNEPSPASTHYSCPVVPQQQQQQKSMLQASWVNDTQDDDNYFATQRQQNMQKQHQHQQQQQQRYQHSPYHYQQQQ